MPVYWLGLMLIVVFSINLRWLPAAGASQPDSFVLPSLTLAETVFGWPGIGQLLVDSIFARDYPTVQGITLTFAFLFILVNLAVDILYGYIDPRIHYG